MLRRCVAVGTDLPLAGWPQNTRVVLVVNGLHTWHIRWARSSRESRTKLPAAERLFAPSYTQENKAGERSCDRAGCGRFERCSYSQSQSPGCFGAIGHGQRNRSERCSSSNNTGAVNVMRELDRKTQL
ncbi:hypothetical protein ILYODFUR_029174 [Ilyodon furcidens]|uniref:Uncharacterized protein n=1 Tax=Ilyodon furcidens TaxID=33524 RepID=A0ABV0TZW0_9TELE